MGGGVVVLVSAGPVERPPTPVPTQPHPLPRLHKLALPVHDEVKGEEAVERGNCTRIMEFLCTSQYVSVV